MLDGEARQEIGKIVEDRTRPFEHANDSMRRTLSSLKGEFAQLHEDFAVQGREHHAFRHETFDNFDEVKTELRALRADQQTLTRRVEALEQSSVLLRTEMHDRFAQVDDRFAQIDDRFAQIDDRFAQIDDRFAQIDDRLAEVLSAIGDLRDRRDDP